MVSLILILIHAWLIKATYKLAIESQRCFYAKRSLPECVAWQPTSSGDYRRQTVGFMMTTFTSRWQPRFYSGYPLDSFSQVALCLGPGHTGSASVCRPKMRGKPPTCPEWHAERLGGRGNHHNQNVPLYSTQVSHHSRQEGKFVLGGGGLRMRISLSYFHIIHRRYPLQP